MLINIQIIILVNILISILVNILINVLIKTLLYLYSCGILPAWLRAFQTSLATAYAQCHYMQYAPLPAAHATTCRSKWYYVQ